MKNPTLVSLYIAAAIALAVAFFVYQPSAPATSNSDCDSVCEFADGDGLPQSVFDTIGRYRTRQGTGSFSVIEFDGLNYKCQTNHHVAGSKGSQGVADFWMGGKLVASKSVRVSDSWFDARKSKDISEFLLPASELGGPLSVIEIAPYGYSDQLKPGDKIYSIGCSDGRWPRARCGNLIKNENGLLYYDPKSIGGDSGSSLYHYSESDQKWYVVGRIAWAIQSPGGVDSWVGLAMSSNRIRDIKAGRVIGSEDLPTGAVPVELAPSKLPFCECALPIGAMWPESHGSAADEPTPIETGVKHWEREKLFDGKIINAIAGNIEEMKNHQRPVLNGIATAVKLIGAAIAVLFFMVGYSIWKTGKLPVRMLAFALVMLAPGILPAQDLPAGAATADCPNGVCQAKPIEPVEDPLNRIVLVPTPLPSQVSTPTYSVLEYGPTRFRLFHRRCRFRLFNWRRR